MLENFRAVQSAAAGFEKAITKVKVRTLTRGDLLETARALVDSYFRTGREAALACGVAESQLADIDSNMQQLLESTHRQTSISVYRDLLRSIRREFVEIEKQALKSLPVGKIPPLRPVDAQIIETLRQLLPSAALSYQQGLADLAGPDRSSWRGPATDLREALRETLDHLAPDKDVTKQDGFKLEAGRNEPTMKQKVRYVLRQRGKTSTAVEASEAAVEAVEAALATFVRSTYTRSNVSTHTPTDRTEVLRVRDFVRISLCELLEIRES